MITEHNILTGHWTTYDSYVRDRIEAAIKNGGTYEFNHVYDCDLRGTVIQVRIYETAEDLDRYQEEMLP